jgi:Rad3-related DNA helicase
MTAILPSPAQILGHPRFPSWYEGQDQVFSSFMDWMASDKRFLCASIPTGSGKSLLAALASTASGRRAVILTATKGLQAQLLRDFSQIGMEDIRGQNSYQCTLSPDLTTDEGPCHSGIWCEHKAKGCLYYDQLSLAKSARLVDTNYSYYLAQTHHSDGLGPIPLLIMDEAHLAFRAVESHLSVYIGRDEVESIGVHMPRGEGFPDWDEWKRWAFGVVTSAREAESSLKLQVAESQESSNPVPSSVLRQCRRMGALVRKLESVYSSLGRWVWERKGSGWLFSPIWPADYSPRLFLDSPKVLLMSAIMTPKTADLLGVPESDRLWMDVPSYFPASNTPIQHISTVRINHRTTDAEMRQWVARIDQIIDRRLDRKGILFPVSYERRNLFMAHTRHSNLVFSHTPEDVVQVVNRFKTAPAPALLVSPTVTSGWDFPGLECEYIIVGKIPFADTRNPVIKARMEDDPDWPGFDAMQTLIQEAGRGTRSASDKCEVLIIDDNWGWFWKKNSQFAPPWFRSRLLRRTDLVPNPLV